jgi:hypothetical protein
MCILCAISLDRVLKILNAMQSRQSSKSETDTSDFKGPCYKLLGLLSGVMLTALVLRHPLLFNNYHTELDDLVPYETHVHRQILELNKKSVFTHLGKKPMSTGDKTVVNYVHDSLLHDSTAQADDEITPLHKTMLLMGCYGNPREIKDILSLPFMTSNSTPPIFYNFMLEALDQFNLHKKIGDVNFSSIHDKSACSCLRDFATPSLLQVLENNDAKCDPYGKNDYQYDTCTMQELLDYTIDSSEIRPMEATRQVLLCPAVRRSVIAKIRF